MAGVAGSSASELRLPVDKWDTSRLVPTTTSDTSRGTGGHTEDDETSRVSPSILQKTDYGAHSRAITKKHSMNNHYLYTSLSLQPPRSDKWIEYAGRSDYACDGEQEYSQSNCKQQVSENPMPYA
ncbi:unnamed protein product [Heligmosomoides polygyrus]|uniref:Uncharacterized protein n=1 Tax=Heligmosomoides polygyrus TaxID=6339 RepID=A0A183GNH8_HELPZ|nr:unnamed protein product [Heligmosomoides polygyrus]